MKDKGQFVKQSLRLRSLDNYFASHFTLYLSPLGRSARACSVGASVEFEFKNRLL